MFLASDLRWTCIALCNAGGAGLDNDRASGRRSRREAAHFLQESVAAACSSSGLNLASLNLVGVAVRKIERPLVHFGHVLIIVTLEIGIRLHTLGILHNTLKARVYIVHAIHPSEIHFRQRPRIPLSETLQVE